MDSEKTLCVMCAWRQACNKKFCVDGTTTTRCPEYTRDVTLKEPARSSEQQTKEGTSQEEE